MRMNYSVIWRTTNGGFYMKIDSWVNDALIVDRLFINAKHN